MKPCHVSVAPLANSKKRSQEAYLVLAWCSSGVILISVKRMLRMYQGVDRHNNMSMRSQLSGAGLRVLLQQAIDEGQQLHHALL